MDLDVAYQERLPQINELLPHPAMKKYEPVPNPDSWKGSNSSSCESSLNKPSRNSSSLLPLSDQTSPPFTSFLSVERLKTIQFNE